MRTVLICDDRRSVREGLTRVMSAVPGVQRIDAVSTADDLLARYSRQHADVVFIGTQRAVSSGAEATRRLMAAHPNANVMVFGAPDDSGSIAAAIAGGARGYRLQLGRSCPELGNSDGLQLKSGVGIGLICGNAGDVAVAIPAAQPQGELIESTFVSRITECPIVDVFALQ